VPLLLRRPAQGLTTMDMSYTRDWVLPADSNERIERIERISKRARKLLGLSEQEANAMFAADNSLTTLRQYVEAMEREENIVAGRKKRGR
jgi:hypothetical protein